MMKRTLDAICSKSDLKTIVEISTHLDVQETNKLYTLLNKYASLFDGNKGTWHGKPYDIKLKPDTEPYHGKYFLFHAYINSRSNKNSINSKLLRS